MWLLRLQQYNKLNLIYHCVVSAISKYKPVVVSHSYETYNYYSNYITPGCDIILQHIFLQSGFPWVVREGVVPAVESFGRGSTVLLASLYKAHTFVSLGTGGCMEGWVHIDTSGLLTAFWWNILL